MEENLLKPILFDDEPDIAKRFQFIIDRYFGTPKIFCDRTGINRGTVSMLLNSKRMRVADTITQLVVAACPEIPAKWVQTGIDPRKKLPTMEEYEKLRQELEDAKRQIARLESVIDIFIEKRNRP